nr:tandem-95 repeat protein [uncultured Rhodoferax sp.]
MGGTFPPGGTVSTRADQIAQWLEDGGELYRRGLVPSPDYIARANLAVDIGNGDPPSMGAANYVDYYANTGKQSAGDPLRMQHVEITGIENGMVSVVFSSAGDELKAVRLTQPIDAGAEGVWNAEICRNIKPNTNNGAPPSASDNGHTMEVVATVSSDGQGNTTVTDHQTGTAVTTSTGSSTNWGGEANHPPTVETQAPPFTSTDHNGPDPYDNHLTRYPVPNSTSGESDTGFTQIEPPAPVNAASPATTIAAPKTPEQLRADALLEAQVADANTAMGFASSIIGLRNWGSQDGLGRLSTVVNFYNQFDRLGASFGGSGNNLPGDLSQFGAGLGVISALKSGNPISIASSGGSFYNSIVGANAANAIPIPVLNSLNLINALNSGNPLSIATSAVSFIPVYGPLLSIGLSVFGALVGGNSGPPPPPDGAVHYTWDENGAITIQTEHNVSGGAQSASNTAGNVLGLLNSVATAQNDKNNAAGQSQHNVAIDPSRMPRIGHTAGQNWLEVTHPDGTTTKETIDPATIGQRMVEIAVENGALAPVWQIDTARAHAVAQAQAQQQAQADATHATQVWDANAIDGDNRPAPTAPASSLLDIDGRAPVAQASAAPANTHNNPTVFGTTGTGVESADHKTISYGALVVHLGTPGAQQAINALQTSNNTTPAATSTALSDTDGDGFFEQTQWVAGQDSQGNVQGMLVLDSNNNGLIETADILHMGGDANSNQRNSMNWLDSNGDGKLDASDPAFAAIKLFIDLNNNGRVDDGEMQSPGLSSINFTTGQVNYSNGTSDALTATTLTAETEGSKVDKIKVVGEDGKLYELNAGSVIVHEGYQGLVRVNNKGEIVADDDPAADNRWVQQRINSYTFNAAHQSDWEGTDKQDQHRHGGKNVESAPTETSATGATSKGPVLGKENVRTYTTMDVGDKRIVSDAPRTSADVGNTNTAPTTITLNAGDARIRSLTPPADQAARVVFVPSGVREGWMTADGKQLLHMPDDGLFGAGGTGSALTAVALGAVQTTAFAVPDKGAAGFTWQTRPLLQDATNTHSGNNNLNFGSTNNSNDSGNASAFGVSAGNYGTVRQLRLGVLLGTAPVDPAHGQVPTYVVGTNTTGTAGGGAAPWQNTVFDYGTPPSAFAADGSAMPQQPVIYNPATGKRPATTQPNPTTPTSDALTPPASNAPAAPQPGAPLAATTPVAPTAPSSPTFTVPPAAPPTNTSASTTNDNLSNPLEDLPLRVGFATLLANDTNASAITLVGNAANGTVAIVGSEVVFTPTPNYHGPASFQYQVVSLDGSFAVGQANFDISAVNDVPLALGETAAATEDSVLQISAASLLANDTDADVATDNQTLTISAVGSASHGTVSLVNGQVQFTPDANYHGTASFKYVVSDGNGGTATATATVQVAAVNDVPVALGEVISGAEDTTLLINPLALLANDTDADVATDNQVLGISSVGNATHGTVSILGTGQIRFVPDANYVGTASFDYVVNDGNGGTVTTTANILVGSTNDAPVASGETVNSQEDQVVTLTAPALLANETDVDNSISSLQIARVTAGTGGSVVLSGGNILFTPNANFSGTASFTYWVKDPDGMESNPATVTVNVAPVNDAPYAQGEVVTGASEDATFTIDRSILLANDGDEEDSNSSLGIELVGNASSGTISMGGGGNLVFTPVANFNGNVSFQYQVRDTSGALSPVVTAQFNVAAVNDTPLGVDEQLTPMYTNTVASPSTATIGFSSLLGNDSDVDNPASDLTVSGVRNASNGTVSIVGGAVVFTPTLNFNGTASFQYQVDDQHGGQTWATAYISVAPPPNLYPSINVTYFNFYPTGTTPAGAWDIGELNWTIADDGNTGLVSVTYLSGSYHVFGNAGGNVSGLPWNDFQTTQTSWYVNVPRTHAVDAFATTWRVVDDRGLENTWHFNYTVGSGFQSYMAFTGYAPPVVLGLNGNSPGYIETQYSNVRYDLNGDGIADQVAWAAPGSGVLGIDLNGDHQISNASEFAFTQYVPGAKTDLEGLRAFDSNHNGLLDAGDAQWAKFGVWEDKNSDGQTQAGEYLTLDTLGIAHISLNGHAPTHPQEKPADGHLTGVAVVGESTFMRTDGSTGQVDDAMLAFQPAPQSEAADLMRMALLFNQYSNTAMDGGSAPLGYVPLQAETPWQEAALTAPQHAMHEVLQSA